MAKMTRRRLRLRQRSRSLVWTRSGLTRPAPVAGLALVKTSCRRLADNWPLFTGLGLLAWLGLALLIYGFGQHLDLATRQLELEQVWDGGWTDQLRISFDHLQFLTNYVTDLTVDFNFYSATVLIILSLILLFLARQIYDGRDRNRSMLSRLQTAVYFGPAQIIPYLLSLAFLFGQALPALLANSLAANLRAGGLLESNASQFLVLAVVLLVNLFSLYLIASTVFALAIVSRPGVSPLAAWVTSWDLTAGRRLQATGWLVLALVLAVLATAIVMVPVLLFLLPVAEYVFYGWLLGLLFAGHIYFYELYRALLDRPNRQPKIKT